MSNSKPDRWGKRFFFVSFRIEMSKGKRVDIGYMNAELWIYSGSLLTFQVIQGFQEDMKKIVQREKPELDEISVLALNVVPLEEEGRSEYDGM